MSVKYAPVKWNRNKLIYDGFLTAGILGYLAVFVTAGSLVWSGSVEILLIRALGTCALIMLHLVLCIGPLARFDRRFLPVLHNRRHFGVATFLVALSHAALTVGYYHGFGARNPLVSLLTSNTNYLSLSGFPFEILGLIGLVILFLMAASSHDFWLKNLSPPVWKGMHMLVYPAYVLLIWHVALGVLQSERSLLYLGLLGFGVVSVTGLHIAAGWRERRRDGALT